MSYIYLASPYSHSDSGVVERRFLAACRATAHLLNSGLVVFSPIVHCHPLAKAHGLPGDFKFWRTYNWWMLAPASELKILRLEGWQISEGVTGERDIAKQYNKPITLMDPIE